MIQGAVMLFDSELDDEVTVIQVREELELAVPSPGLATDPVPSADSEPPALPIPLVARKVPAVDRITLELDALDVEALAEALCRDGYGPPARAGAGVFGRHAEETAAAESEPALEFRAIGSATFG